MSPTAVTKPVLPPLQTPKTASFPSEICSTPISACVSAVIKQEADLRTPITPPTAYTDFLKALTPILASPPPSALTRLPSDDSIASKETSNSNPSTTTSSSFSSQLKEAHRSPTTASLPPPTPLSATSNPAQRRMSSGLKRLRIPQAHSPAFSPTATACSPRTAMSGLSNPSSAMMFSPYSPVDWSQSSRIFDNIATTPRSACSKPVSVRYAVTRTVTYKRTTPNLEPAPKGKRRRLDGSTVSSDCASSTASVSSEDEAKKMPPPTMPVINVKESTPEKASGQNEPAVKSENEVANVASVPAAYEELDRSLTPEQVMAQVAALPVTAAS